MVVDLVQVQPLSEDAVVVVNEVSRAALPVTDLTELVLDRMERGTPCHPSTYDASRIELHDDKDVVRLEGDRVLDEKITSEQPAEVTSEKRAPRLR